MGKNFSFTVVIALMLILCFSLPILGDVGNFNDYGGGSTWDSGGSTWDWSDSGTSSGNYYFGGSVGGASSGGGGWVMAILVVAGVFLLFLLRNKMQKQRRRNVPPHGMPGNIPTGVSPQAEDHTKQILPGIFQVDPQFNAEEFVAWTKEVFITMQQAWTERDWAKIRPFEKEELYRQHEAQLQEYVKLGRINVIERININQAFLHHYTRDKEYETLSVYMQVRMVDYIKDEKTNAVLKGDPNTDCHLNYLLTFMRKTGVVTKAEGGNSIVACPHCGAPTAITSAGQCEYCGFIVTTGEYSWVLSDMEGVKPQTVIDNSGVTIYYTPEDNNVQDK